jgi:signal transduction histidine kinase
MRILVAFTVTLGLTVALAWLPMPGVWWHVVRWAAYLPILSVSARHGPIAGLWAGLAASLFWALAMGLRGTDNVAWLSILLPDFVAVGLLGGRLLGVWPRSRQRFSATEADAWPDLRRTSKPEVDLSLNPIASIQFAAGILAEEDTSADVRQELAGIISKECGRLSASITGLLQASHAAESPQFCEADLASIIDAAVREAEFVLSARGVVVRKVMAPELTTIQCYPDQLRNLVRSLTINAVHSAPAGEEVVLNARHGEDGVILELRGHDKRSFINRGLGRFFGARPETTGVGLAAAYDIVRRHGGRIGANINVRKGFEFSVWLPLRRNCGDGNWQGAGGGGR